MMSKLIGRLPMLWHTPLVQSTLHHPNALFFCTVQLILYSHGESRIWVSGSKTREEFGISMMQNNISSLFGLHVLKTEIDFRQTLGHPFPRRALLPQGKYLLPISHSIFQQASLCVSCSLADDRPCDFLDDLVSQLRIVQIFTPLSIRP